MRLLVYEYLTGGGLWSAPATGAHVHPLLAEGHSMVQAVCDDLAQVEGIELVQFRDTRWNGSAAAAHRVVDIRSQREELDQLASWSGQADAVLLIAPEWDGCLLERCERVQCNGGRLVSPDPAFVRLATDKHATAQRLASAGVPVPNAVLIHSLSSTPPPDPACPQVLKPVDGVGSLCTYLISNEADWGAVRTQWDDMPPRRWRLEQWCAGTAASVSALCGPRGFVLLPPCRQRIADNGRFTYLGGAYPLAPPLTRRACQLARRTLAALPPTTGYIGIDMILADDPDSQSDVVLEVNPRLTTSYVGLRRAAQSNLAAAMLAVAHGTFCPLFFRQEEVEFDCCGITLGH